MSSGEHGRRWREPTRALPLRWGSYEGRLLGGLWLILCGTICLQGANPYIGWPLLAGTTAAAVGWAILPARGWRRVTVQLPAIAMVWLLLTGPQSIWVVSLGVASWLLVRHRPVRSWIVIVFPIALGTIIPSFLVDYRWMPVALVSGAAVAIVAAWSARAIHRSRDLARRSPTA